MFKSWGADGAQQQQQQQQQRARPEDGWGAVLKDWSAAGEVR